MKGLLRQSKGEDVVALLGAEFAVTSGGDEQVLFARDGIGHRRGLAAGGQFVLPQFVAGIGIKGA